ncbi:MAG: hydrogenase expression/formation protein HypE [Myxococcota bacterium]
MTRRPDVDALLAPSCPSPSGDATADRVQLSHGAGAGATARLFDELLLPAFANPALAARHDGAVLDLPGGAGRLAFTTDTFVVSPLAFPGGDIGALAVHGTLNDLAMCGARPLALSCGLVLEEGLPLERLRSVVTSLGRAAEAAGVPIVTGDTKVVEHGKGDGVFVNTAGVGVVPDGRALAPDRVRPGDAVLVSGDLARHGVAVLSVREGIAFESPVESDSAALPGLVEALLAAAPDVHCLRDPTRGGVGAVLHEIAAASGAEIELHEASLPLDPAVEAACELLGLDPLFLASEGRLLAFVPEARVDAALAALRAHPLGRGAARIGRVGEGPARVVVETRIGARRLLPLPAGEPLPRIC